MKLAVVDNGLFHRSIFAKLGREVRYIPICALPASNIINLDVLVILSHTNEQVLYACKENLEQFLKWGGVLVVMGFYRYEESFISYVSFQPTELVPTFSSCDNDDSRFLFGPPIQIDKSGLHAHGYLDGIPADSVIASEDKNGKPHTIIIRNSGGGSVLITTLDPDFHIHSIETTFASRDNCRLILDRILTWAEVEAQRSLPHNFRLLRESIAFLFNRRLRLRIMIGLMILATVILSVVIYNNPSYRLFSAISAACSVVALVLALFEFKDKT